MSVLDEKEKVQKKEMLNAKELETEEEVEALDEQKEDILKEEKITVISRQTILRCNQEKFTLRIAKKFLAKSLSFVTESLGII